MGAAHVMVATNPKRPPLLGVTSDALPFNGSKHASELTSTGVVNRIGKSNAPAPGHVQSRTGQKVCKITPIVVVVVTLTGTHGNPVP